MFSRIVEQAAGRGLLDSTFRIDSTDLEALTWNDEALWNYDPKAEEYYYGFGLKIVSAGSKIPVAAGVYAGETGLEGDGDARYT